MLEACAQVDQEYDSSFNGEMSDKNPVGTFSCKVETAIKSITHLVNMEIDKDLFGVLHADHSVPKSAAF